MKNSEVMTEEAELAAPENKNGLELFFWYLVNFNNLIDANYQRLLQQNKDLQKENRQLLEELNRKG